VVVIRDAGGGRYEVLAEGRHWETFNQASGALSLAEGLARRVAVAKGRAVMIKTPWGSRSVESPTANAPLIRS